MATAYQQSQYNNYAVRQNNAYSVPEAATNHYLGSNGYQGSVQHPRYSSSLSQSSSTSAALAHRESVYAKSGYKQVLSPQSNRTNTLPQPDRQPRPKSANGNVNLPNLQIPPSINNSGGSLAEFAAQITCLFWFESTETLQKAEALTSASSPVKRLRDEAVSSSRFKKWVVTILSTTQVTQNVTLLALLFIYRLKTINPLVKGRSGSEYRLLTVALMLGNKFLDDNTYTNKTWAQVSGISVTEIHVMEVEFLSNMRYSLLASAEEWEEWQEKLGKFWIYCDKATRIPPPLVSPLPLSGHPTLPSPPTSMQASPPSLPNPYSVNSSPYAYSPQWSAATSTAPVLSPLSSLSDQGTFSARKRSFAGDVNEPPPKRATRSTPNGPVPFAPAAPSIRRNAPRLPVPNLTISTSQPMANGYTGNNNFPQHVPVLLPLNGRAMSAVFPSTPTWTPQLPMLTTSGPSNQHGPHSAGPQSAGGHGTPSSRQSPHPLHDLLSFGSSPISSTFPSHASSHVSPSYFLQQRTSPYKPVRHVNTLLYPPPSASMHDYSANTDQMHYQPLGKRNEYRSGVVPDYYQHWPILPQPHFTPS